MVVLDSFEKENINDRIDNTLDDTPATSEETGKSLTLDNAELNSLSSKNSTSFFFTGIDFAKPSSKNNKDSSLILDIGIMEISGILSLFFILKLF